MLAAIIAQPLSSCILRSFDLASPIWPTMSAFGNGPNQSICELPSSTPTHTLEGIPSVITIGLNMLSTRTTWATAAPDTPSHPMSSASTQKPYGPIIFSIGVAAESIAS